MKSNSVGPTSLSSVRPTIRRGGFKAFRHSFFSCFTSDFTSLKCRVAAGICQQTYKEEIKSRKQDPIQEKARKKDILLNTNFAATSNETEEGNLRTYIEQFK